MNLLPKTHKEFSSKQYWNTFFSNIGSKSFEWYGEYLELCGLLHKYMRTNDRILVAGCGNSTLSADLYKHGFKEITNVDISEIVIKQMSKKYEGCEAMKWVQADLTTLQFAHDEFSCVLDKGTLDALMTDDSPEVVSTIDSYFEEMSRVLRIGGRYICVSLLQEHILDHVMSWFPRKGWMIRICRCEDAEKSQMDKGSFSFPVFVIVCTKFKQMPNFKPMLELCLHGDINKRVDDIKEVISSVKSLQQYALLRHNLHNERVAGDNMGLELCDAKTGAVRYVLHIVDAPKKTNKMKFAVFIVPQGREVEWMFGTSEGQSELAESAGSSRLIVVHLVRGGIYLSLQTIQEELSSKVMELSPSSLPSNTKVPFLSVGEDLGCRTEQMRSHSEYCGDYIVEDISQDGKPYLRRLVFLSNQNIVQSEAKLISVNSKKKKKGSTSCKTETRIDFSHLSCEHHLAMVTGIGLSSNDAKVLLVGLGGGLLATYIHNYLEKVHLTVVEIDKAMVETAKLWFGFQPDLQLSVEVADGLDFIVQSANQGVIYDVIMFDVDSKDSNIGMSCPPKKFVERNFLDQVAKCLSERGVFILNLVCRDENLRTTVLEDVKSIFPTIICQQIPQDLNQVLFCTLKKYVNEDLLKSEFETNISALNNTLKIKQKNKNIINIRETLCQIKIL